jgi:hypothetical protein
MSAYAVMIRERVTDPQRACCHAARKQFVDQPVGSGCLGNKRRASARDGTSARCQ